MVIDNEFLMLTIGQKPPPSWKDSFKIYPETSEERLQRLSGARFRRQTGGAKSVFRKIRNIAYPYPVPTKFEVFAAIHKRYDIFFQNKFF